MLPFGKETEKDWKVKRQSRLGRCPIWHNGGMTETQPQVVETVRVSAVVCPSLLMVSLRKEKNVG